MWSLGPVAAGAPAVPAAAGAGAADAAGALLMLLLLLLWELEQHGQLGSNERDADDENGEIHCWEGRTRAVNSIETGVNSLEMGNVLHCGPFYP